MKTKTGWTALIVAISVAGAPFCACAANSQAAKPVNNVQRLAPLIFFVKSSGVSVWIEYHATCAPSEPENIPLDLTIHNEIKGGKTDPVSAVRDLVNGDTGVSVSQIRPGLIGIKSDDVWASVFRAKLVELKLDNGDRYNPNDAISAGINAADASLEALRDRPVIKFGGLAEIPSKGRPHLEASAKYATLGDLLDDVTRTFGGILVYRECARAEGTHLFDIHFYRKDADYDYRDWPIGHTTSP